MVRDEQVRILMKLINQEKTLATAAAKAGMSEKTARKFRDLKRLPSQCAAEHDWSTHPDAFAGVWPWVELQLKSNEGLEAKTLFEALQREHHSQFPDGQLRTFQRRVKTWRALHGPAKEVFFTQVYDPGIWCSSDFTRMGKLGITINGIAFDHMLYHFVLCYCNWETFTICYSESFESLSNGLQNALWELGCVPRYHRTDNLTSAVNKVGNPQEFTEDYDGLCRHYGITPIKTQPASPNENGDIEQRHRRLKDAVEQALILRGSKDFSSIADYEKFLRKLFGQLNSNRKDKLREELAVLHELPHKRLDDFKSIKVKVSQNSTIRLLKNSYSVHSRMIGETVRCKVHAEHITVWYAQRKVETLPRLHGENKHKIDYRHIIDWLVRKPGAFDHYCYKDDLFPSSIFRIAYDHLCQTNGQKNGAKLYLKLLYLAAKESESTVTNILRTFIIQHQPIDVDMIKAMVDTAQSPPPIPPVYVEQPSLGAYDMLLEEVCV
jgi:transposase InsO family protein